MTEKSIVLSILINNYNNHYNRQFLIDYDRLNYRLRSIATNDRILFFIPTLFGYDNAASQFSIRSPDMTT